MILKASIFWLLAGIVSPLVVLGTLIVSNSLLLGAILATVWVILLLNGLVNGFKVWDLEIYWLGHFSRKFYFLPPGRYYALSLATLYKSDQPHKRVTGDGETTGEEPVSFGYVAELQIQPGEKVARIATRLFDQKLFQTPEEALEAAFTQLKLTIEKAVHDVIQNATDWGWSGERSLEFEGVRIGYRYYLHAHSK